LKVWIVIPAYNEEENIAKVILQTKKYVDKVIVCDDGSTDMTYEIAKALGVEVVRHEQNKGYGAALATLFNKAREEKADIMITLDGDGQHNPNDIPKLIKPIADGEADIVIGSRFLEKGQENMPKYRKVGVAIITKLTGAVSYKEVSDAQSGYRAYNKRAIELIKPAETGMGASTEILIKAHEHGLKIKEVQTKILYGKNTSTQNPIYHGLDVILSTIKHLSIRHPLVFYGTPGLIALSIATIFWVWTLETFTRTRQIITNVTLVAIGATMVGLILLTTAVMLWVIISLLKEKS